MSASMLQIMPTMRHLPVEPDSSRDVWSPRLPMKDHVDRAGKYATQKERFFAAKPLRKEGHSQLAQPSLLQYAK